jgi:hypothetical protein
MFYRLTTAIAAWGALAALALPGAPSPASAQNVILPFVPLPAWGDSVITGNCFGSRRTESCITMFRKLNPNPYVIHVPAPVSEQEIAEYRQRDMRWEERCKPTIRQDAFGVSRYAYAARGCEFGILE